MFAVPDQSTSLLMERFYENWLSGDSKSTALRNAALSILHERREQHGAAHDRIRPFVEPIGEVHTPTSGKLYAFRDDLGQWIAFATEREARAYAYRDDISDSGRTVEEVSFGALLDDAPRNLVHLNRQYYWAEDLA